MATAIAIGLGAPTTRERYRGKYTSLVSLQAAWPIAYDGDWAHVDAGTGSNLVRYEWDAEEGWVSASVGSSYVFTNGVQDDGSGNVSIGGNIDADTSLDIQPGILFDLNGTDGASSGATISIAGSGVYGPDAQVRIGGNSLGQLIVTSTSFQFEDTRATPVGMEYVANYGATMGPRSIPDTEYTNSRLGGQVLSSTPGPAQDGYIYAWNNTNQEWDLVPNVSTSYSFQSGLTELAGVVTLGGTASQNIALNSDVAGSRTFAVGIVAPFNSVSLRASNVGNTSRSNLSLSSTLAGLSRSVGANSFSINLGDTGGIITDQLGTGGLQNFADYSASWTDRNLIDKGFSTSHIGAQAIDTLVKNPTVAQHGYFIAWNNTNLEYELLPRSLGTSAQIPYMNPGGTDFSYEAGFEYNPFANLFIVPSIQLGNTSQAGGSSIVVQSSSADANLTLQAKGSGIVISASQFFQVGSDFLFDSGSGEITRTGDINLLNTGNVRILNSLEVPDIFNLLTLTGTDGHSSSIDGFQLSFTAGNAYATSGDGNGGNVLIQSGQKRAAGSGVDGSIVLNTWFGNLAFADSAPNFNDGSRITYLQDAVALPTANPTNGVYIYPVNGELYVYNETGVELSLSGRVTKVTESGAAVTLTQAHRGTTVKITDNNPTITLSDLGDDFQCAILFTGTGTVSFAGYTNFFSVGGADQITDQYGMVYLYHESGNNWYAKGDLV